MNEPARTYKEESTLSEKISDKLRHLLGLIKDSTSLKETPDDKVDITSFDHIEAEQDNFFPPHEQELREEYLMKLTAAIKLGKLKNNEYLSVVNAVDTLLSGQSLSESQLAEIARSEKADTVFAQILTFLNGPEADNPDLFNSDLSQAHLFHDDLYLNKIKSIWEDVVTNTKENFGQT